MENNDRIGGNSIAHGYAVGVSVLAISAQIVVFPLLGFWVDSKLHTSFVFGALGFVIGLYTAVRQLIRLTQNDPPLKK
ncbi:MAG: AtpZ/AtpI family protein [Planctomycetaceae bacterium]|jgi:uncharacterized protein YneF (UPF0154 family)|nr:AtpZ/AtpI family protein [Planctomycetaceae bacterium]